MLNLFSSKKHFSNHYDKINCSAFCFRVAILKIIKLQKSFRRHWPLAGQQFSRLTLNCTCTAVHVWILNNDWFQLIDFRSLMTLYCTHIMGRWDIPGFELGSKFRGRFKNTCCKCLEIVSTLRVKDLERGDKRENYRTLVIQKICFPEIKYMYMYIRISRVFQSRAVLIGWILTSVVKLHVVFWHLLSIRDTQVPVLDLSYSCRFHKNKIEDFDSHVLAEIGIYFLF